MLEKTSPPWSPRLLSLSSYGDQRAVPIVFRATEKVTALPSPGVAGIRLPECRVSASSGWTVRGMDLPALAVATRLDGV